MTFAFFPAISLGFIILFLLLRSQLFLWGSPFFFFFCVPSFLSGVHHSSSSSAFPAFSLGFTILLLLCSQLYLWVHHSSSSSVFPAISLGSLFLFFFVSSCISRVHHSFSPSFTAVSLAFTILLLCFQLYLWVHLSFSAFQAVFLGSPFFFFCIPSYISGFTIPLLLHSQLCLWGSPFFFFFVPS